MRRAASTRLAWTLGAAAAALPSLVGFGCGEESFVVPPWDAGAIDTSHAEACHAWAEHVCDYDDRCPPPIVVRWANRSQCVERSVLACELVAEDPSVAFDDRAVAACAYPTDCTAPLPSVLCLGPGALPTGAACAWNKACASSECNRSGSGGDLPACGTCAPAFACDAACNGGQFCLPEDGGDRCVRVPDAGEVCSGDGGWLCNDSLCSAGPEGDGGAGVCVPFAHAGETCGGDVLCGPDPDLFCGASGRCALATAMSYGEPCGPDAGELARCVGFGKCDGTCVPPAPDGALCDPAQGLDCLPPARCIHDHCLFPGPAYCSP